MGRPTWQIRYHDLLQRVEARLAPVDHGEVETLFPTVEDVADAHAAADRLMAAYPNAATTHVTPIDAAWFPALCRSYPKPMPFVPILDDDLIRWWGQDCLWQAQRRALQRRPGPYHPRPGVRCRHRPRRRARRLPAGPLRGRCRAAPG